MKGGVLTSIDRDFTSSTPASTLVFSTPFTPFGALSTSIFSGDWTSSFMTISPSMAGVEPLTGFVVLVEGIGTFVLLA